MPILLIERVLKIVTLKNFDGYIVACPLLRRSIYGLACTAMTKTMQFLGPCGGERISLSGCKGFFVEVTGGWHYVCGI